ncbi:DUF1707 SHOCT-like domain-containing protein [Parasphingorhabdus pacifica]
MGKKPGKDVRVGNPERERAIALLGEHLAAGRLDVDEYDQRCFTLAGARFASEITAAFDDLPAPHPSTTPTTEQPVRADIGGGRLLAVLGIVVALLFVVLTRQLWLLAIVAVVAVLWFTRRS